MTLKKKIKPNKIRRLKGELFMTTNTKGFKVQLSGSEDGFTELLTDTLIAKRDPENWNNFFVIALSLIGTKSDIRKIAKKNSGALLKVNEKGNPYTSNNFKITKFSDFETTDTDGGFYTRSVFVRKKEAFIDQTKEVKPVIIMPKSEEPNLNRNIFEKVRDSIVAPLFPDWTKPTAVSKELLISLEEAKQVLVNVEQGIVNTEAEKFTLDARTRYFAWVDFLSNQLRARKKLVNLDVVCFNGEDVLAYELAITESEVREIITLGIKSGKISISNQHNHTSHFATFDTYMGEYAPIFKKVIENQMNPLHSNGDIRETTLEYFKTLGRSPISAQVDAIEAMLKSIKFQNKVNIVGEPGVGKTFMMSSTVYLDALYNNKPLKAIVLSPDHLVKTAWESEIKITLPTVSYHHIKSIQDLIKFEKEGYLTDDKHRFFILSQAAAKGGYNEKPTAIWNSDEKVFTCPDCFEVMEKKVMNDKDKIATGSPKYIDIPVSFDHYSTQREANRKCKKCRTVLWSPNNRRAKTFKEYKTGEIQEKQFIYSEMGFIPKCSRTVAYELTKAVRNHNEKSNRYTKAKVEQLRGIQMAMDGTIKEKKQVSSYKVPVSEYIFKKLNKQFTHLIIDEFHEYQASDSSRSEAAAQLISSVRKIITGTGTMMNGYAKSIFFNLFMLFPQKMKKAGFTVEDSEKFQIAFGVTEKRFRVVENKKRRLLSTKAKPGISPVIFHKFLQDSTVFISMEDLKMNMPELNTKIVAVGMTDELKNGKLELEKAVRTATKGDAKLFKGMMPTLYSYLDSPTVPKDIKDADGNILYTTPKLDDSENKKLDALKDILRKEVVAGRKTIVYSYYTGDGINNYLQKELQADGFRVTVLNKNTDISYSCDGTELKVAKDNRENFVKDEVVKGSEVLIVNPILVQTGTNLIDFASIVYYQMSYQVYTVRQADRRTWRIGQTQDCTIYYLFYADSFQADIASLMATKIVAAEAIEGKMDAKGLDAITNDRTPEEELAKKFFEAMKF
jgi:hypothetical protein